ncbi:MAG: folate-binding protein [Herminiimonas sp.]|nr:folate-binding protein [Herminiimonas sp.]MDB5855721.1 folate-binding protein [Herminiimonas sp.]
MTEPISASETQLPGTWLQFLQKQSALPSESTASSEHGFTRAGTPAQDTTGFFAPLPSLGLIAATGDEAAKFLHNQLTNDVENLSVDEARLAGYCTAKGRLLATLLMWQSDGVITMQLPREIQATVQKRLQMFIMRAKAKLADVSEAQVAIGFAGGSAALALQRWFPVLPEPVWSVRHGDPGTLIRMPDADGLARYQWIAPVEQAMAAWPALVAALPLQKESAWRLQEIHAGLPKVVQATQEQFVPQMINFEAIGGVNFRKGCYPGQEIVARSQYLGKLKRRMLPATIRLDENERVAASPGAEIFSDADPAQPAGQIVNIEFASEGEAHCLVELKTAALESGALHLESPSGPVLHMLPLPYALIDPT